MFLDITKRPLTFGHSFVLLISVFFVDAQWGRRNPGIVTTTAQPTHRPTVTDSELRIISARLFSLDVEGLYGYPDLDIQNRVSRTGTGDLAPRKLFNNSHIPPNWESKPTFKRLQEVITSPSLINAAQKTAFLEAIMKDQIILEAHSFLKDKGFFPARHPIASFKQYLKTIWFDQYAKSRTMMSSGFNHVFLGEWANSMPSGMHYWMKYQLEESINRMKYVGYTKALKIGNTRTCAIALPLQWEGVTKSLTTMTTCSSPALDIALYTICFLARPNALCPVQAGPNFHSSHNIKNPLTTSYFIQTFEFRQNNRIYVKTAYPVITRPLVYLR